MFRVTQSLLPRIDRMALSTRHSNTLLCLSKQFKCKRTCPTTMTLSSEYDVRVRNADDVIRINCLSHVAALQILSGSILISFPVST